MAPRTLLIICVCLVPCLCAASRGRCVPGAPCDVRSNDSSILKVALSAAELYNNQSDDAFLFRACSVRRAQRQVVKGVRFIVDLDLSRTVCRKRDRTQNLQDCDFQPPGVLHQVFRCHIEVWVVPWDKHNTTQKFFCKTSASANQEADIVVA